MNWRRSSFRLWVLLSVLWVVSATVWLVATVGMSTLLNEIGADFRLGDFRLGMKVSLFLLGPPVLLFVVVSIGLKVAGWVRKGFRDDT